MNKHIGVAVCWYQREQWDKIKSLREDRAVMADSYDEWLAGAENAVKQIKSKGFTPFPVDIDANELQAWCRRNGLNINSNACTRFANEKVADAMKKRGEGN